MKRKARRTFALLAALAATVPLVLLATQSSASAGAGSNVTGALPPAAVGYYKHSTVTVYGMPNLSNPKVGDSAGLIKVASSVVSASVFRLAVPHSAALDKMVEGGNVNVAVETDTPKGSNLTFGVIGYDTPTAPLSTEAAPTLALGELTEFAGAPVSDSSGPQGAPPGKCSTLFVTATKTNVATVIGETHAANAAISSEYKAEQSADSTFTVGLQETKGGFEADGTSYVGNNAGSGGSFADYGPYRQYVEGTFDYTQYGHPPGADCAWVHIMKATSWHGDVYRSPHQAAPNPYGSCAADPHGVARVPAKGGGEDGTWDQARGKAWGYSGAATVFGFSFTDSTGFSSDNTDTYSNSGAVPTYVCGNNTTPNESQIVWNSVS